MAINNRRSSGGKTSNRSSGLLVPTTENLWLNLGNRMGVRKEIFTAETQQMRKTTSAGLKNAPIF